jgi:hypothetical protein
MYQLRALCPFQYRGVDLATGDLITIETEQDERDAELLKQHGAVASHYGEASPQPLEPSETATPPLTSHDTAPGNIGRRNRG